MNPILEPAGERPRIDVISDVVCPWCYIGKRQLEGALARWRDEHPEGPEPLVRWHPFQLNPEMPAEGMDRGDYMASKFGSRDPQAIYQRVQAAAAREGLELNIAGISRQPSTLGAHALIAAAAPELQDAMAEALFQAYFVEGQDIGSSEVLRAIARSAGLADAAIEAALAGDFSATAQADREARELGVSGVPFFVFDGKRGVSGAQGTDAIYGAMQRD